MDFIETIITFVGNIFIAISNTLTINPFDLFIIFLIFGFLLGFSLRYGKRQIITLLFSLYFASFISLQFPYTELLLGSRAGDIELAAGVVAAVFIFFIILYVIFNRVTKTMFFNSSASRWVEASILSAVTTTLILSLSYHVLPVVVVYDFSPAIDMFFEPKEYFFWWLIIPLVTLLFVGKKQHEEE